MFLFISFLTFFETVKITGETRQVSLFDFTFCIKIVEKTRPKQRAGRETTYILLSLEQI